MVLRRVWTGLAFLLAVLAPSFGAVSATPAVPGFDPSAVDRFVSDYLSRTGLPGAAVAITHGAEVVYLGGFGHDATGAAITPSTPMPIASVSKSMTALAVMQLVDAGQVHLDDPARQYLPDFQPADPRGERITVRELLNQTSGMSDTAFPDLRRPQAASLTGAVERLRSAELASDPGTRFHYHNPNYQVLARLVEVVSGVPFADYMRRNVFGPIGMRDTTTVDTAEDAKDVTHGYVRAYGVPISVPEPEWFVNGSHGVITTATDMAQWLITQNRGGTTVDGHQVVSTGAVTEMHTPAPVGSRDYGMGWWRTQSDDGVEFWHKGDWFTYTAEQILLPDSGYGIAVIGDTGLALEDDPGIIADGLVAITRGETPELRRPIGTYADWGLAVLTLATLGLGVFGVRRSRRWAHRFADRPAWLIALTLLPLLIPIPILIFLPELAGLFFSGRAGTFRHVTYVWPALVIYLVIGAVVGLVVLAGLAIQFAMARRGRVGPGAEQSEQGGLLGESGPSEHGDSPDRGDSPGHRDPPRSSDSPEHPGASQQPGGASTETN